MLALNLALTKSAFFLLVSRLLKFLTFDSYHTMKLHHFKQFQAEGSFGDSLGFAIRDTYTATAHTTIAYRTQLHTCTLVCM